jgi:hypothetical protein
MAGFLQVPSFHYPIVLFRHYTIALYDDYPITLYHFYFIVSRQDHVSLERRTKSEYVKFLS